MERLQSFRPVMQILLSKIHGKMENVVNVYKLTSLLPDAPKKNNGLLEQLYIDGQMDKLVYIIATAFQLYNYTVDIRVMDKRNIDIDWTKQKNKSLQLKGITVNFENN